MISSQSNFDDLTKLQHRLIYIVANKQPREDTRLWGGSIMNLEVM